MSTIRLDILVVFIPLSTVAVAMPSLMADSDTVAGVRGVPDAVTLGELSSVETRTRHGAVGSDIPLDDSLCVSVP